MRHPHGLRRDPFLDGYIVTDTGNERVSFMSADGKKELAIDSLNLKAPKTRHEKVKW